MLKEETQVKQPMTVVVGPQPEDKPQFSEEFLGMIHDHIYETLRAHLEKTNQEAAVKLLDDLVIVSCSARGSAEQWIKDQMLSEAIGQASHHVLQLGGRFYRASEVMEAYR